MYSTQPNRIKLNRKVKTKAGVSCKFPNQGLQVPRLRFAGTKMGVTQRTAVHSIQKRIGAVRNEAQAAGPSRQTADDATTRIGVVARFQSDLRGDHLVALEALGGARSFSLMRCYLHDHYLRWLLAHEVCSLL